MDTKESKPLNAVTAAATESVTDDMETKPIDQKEREKDKEKEKERERKKKEREREREFRQDDRYKYKQPVQDMRCNYGHCGKKLDQSNPTNYDHCETCVNQGWGEFATFCSKTCKTLATSPNTSIGELHLLIHTFKDEFDQVIHDLFEVKQSMSPNEKLEPLQTRLETDPETRYTRVLAATDLKSFSTINLSKSSVTFQTKYPFRLLPSRTTTTTPSSASSTATTTTSGAADTSSTKEEDVEELKQKRKTEELTLKILMWNMYVKKERDDPKKDDPAGKGDVSNGSENRDKLKNYVLPTLRASVEHLQPEKSPFPSVISNEKWSIALEYVVTTCMCDEFNRFIQLGVMNELNHSCTPNAFLDTVQKNSTIDTKLIVTSPIGKGEEITVNYLKEYGLLSYPARRQMLWSTWKFKCGCVKCLNQIEFCKKFEKLKPSEIKKHTDRNVTVQQLIKAAENHTLLISLPKWLDDMNKMLNELKLERSSVMTVQHQYDLYMASSGLLSDYITDNSNEITQDTESYVKTMIKHAMKTIQLTSQHVEISDVRIRQYHLFWDSVVLYSIIVRGSAPESLLVEETTKQMMVLDPNSESLVRAIQSESLNVYIAAYMKFSEQNIRSMGIKKYIPVTLQSAVQSKNKNQQ